MNAPPTQENSRLPDSLMATWDGIPWYQKHNTIITWFVVGLFFGGLTLVPISINAFLHPVYFKPKKKDLSLRKWSLFTKVSLLALSLLWLGVVINYGGPFWWLS